MADPNPHPKADYGRNVNSPDVLIIGAGISGLCIAIEMTKAGQGRNFIIVEKGSQVGGTWNDNVYPGCCCDVLSHLYSYSFELNPDWTREYPGQEEIQDHLIAVAHKYQLYKHIRFNSSVTEARWDDTNNKWRTTIRRFGQEAETGEDYTIRSDFLVSAVGQLSVPRYPRMSGLELFEGKIMHSARWDWNFSIQGKRVGIIGTGATAAQIIPEIAQSTSQLTVFQRTPAWVMPRHDKAISSTRQAIYRYLPFAQRRYRAGLMDFRESVFEATVKPESARHFHVTSVSRQHMLGQLPSSASAKLREALTPDYPFSCKRIIVSDDYYPTLLRQNVKLETSAISNITPTGIQMENGTHRDLDVIILATGFRTHEFLYPMRIYGMGGQPLSNTWSKGASAYLGIEVENLPNFGILYGPNTNLAYNSEILQIEAQSLYLIRLISAVLTQKRKGRTLTVQPKPEVVERYDREVQDQLSRSTFADPSCTSWFKDEHGRITTNWCGSAIDYQKRTCYLDWNDYEVLGSGAAEVQKRGVERWRRRVEETQVSDRNCIICVAAVVLTGLTMWAAWACK
ncbi:hypothetical protein ACLMJK_002568 [Lecanora helva]